MKNRGMFYQNLNQGYSQPGTFIPPSGYNINTQYQAYGDNGQFYNNQANYVEEDDIYEKRISKLERQVKNLDTRLQKLESLQSTDDNAYMI